MCVEPPGCCVCWYACLSTYVGLIGIDPGVHVGRFPLTCGGFIFSHIHIGLILSLSHATENPGSWALSGSLLSLGNLRCHCRQKEPWNPSNSSGDYYLLYQRKITLLPKVPPPPLKHKCRLLIMLPPSFHFSHSILRHRFSQTKPLLPPSSPHNEINGGLWSQ